MSEIAPLIQSGFRRRQAASVSCHSGRRRPLLQRLGSRFRPPSDDPTLFLNATAQTMTRSGFEYLLAKQVSAAARREPSIAGKRVTPHVLHHMCAMHTLRATRDVRKVSLWLGHGNRRDRTAAKTVVKKASGAYIVRQAQLPACAAGRDGDRGKTTVVTFARKKNNRKGFCVRSELNLELTLRRWLKFRLALEKWEKLHARYIVGKGTT